MEEKGEMTKGEKKIAAMFDEHFDKKPRLSMKLLQKFRAEYLFETQEINNVTRFLEWVEERMKSPSKSQNKR
jgi:hypothetical protein